MEQYLQPKGEENVSLLMQGSIKEEEMDAEQDGNMKIKMSGKKMKEGSMMTDKTTNEGTQQQIISEEASTVKVDLGK